MSGCVRSTKMCWLNVKMERGLSPLVNIARATEVCAAERNGDWHEEPADENCNRFQEEIVVGSQCCTGHEVVPPSFGVGLDLTGEAILIFSATWLGMEES